MKKIIFLAFFIIFTILLIFLSILTYNDFILNNQILACNKNIEIFSENNKNTIFSIDKIIYFSTANADFNVNNNSSFSIDNLYQYTDIAIFINNHAENNYTAENTLKKVILSDIDYILKPSLGTPSLYYKNLNDFTKNVFDKNNLIEKTIEFETTAEDTIDYSTKTLFNNCANPITLCYLNSNIKNSYTLADEISNISHNGTLLKTCNITLNSINCKVSFLITIINNLDEVFTCPITLNIPLSTESSSLYDGVLQLNDSTNYLFIKK